MLGGLWSKESKLKTAAKVVKIKARSRVIKLLPIICDIRQYILYVVLYVSRSLQFQTPTASNQLHVMSRMVGCGAVTRPAVSWTAGSWLLNNSKAIYRHNTT